MDPEVERIKKLLLHAIGDTEDNSNRVVFTVGTPVGQGVDFEGDSMAFPLKSPKEPPYVSKSKRDVYRLPKGRR